MFPLVLVTCRAFRPSRSAIQTSPSLRKAILPSRSLISSARTLAAGNKTRPASRSTTKKVVLQNFGYGPISSPPATPVLGSAYVEDRDKQGGYQPKSLDGRPLARRIRRAGDGMPRRPPIPGEE